jgi:chromate reductase
MKAEMFNVAVLVGSLRANSTNRRFAEALEKLAAGKLQFTYVDIGSLPYYDDALWGDPPESVQTLKQQIAGADAVLFVTPEYNRSIPGVLKNAIDWGSRPYGDSVWQGKPAAIAGATGGVSGTAAAQAHLRAIVPILGAALLGRPEVYFQSKPDSIDEAGNVTDERVRTNLGIFIDRFVEWIGKFAEPREAVTEDRKASVA